MYSEYAEYFSLFEYNKMIEYTLNSMSYKTEKEPKKRKQPIEFNIIDGVLYRYSGRKSIVVIPDNVKIIKTETVLYELVVLLV